ncbi:MAG: hypothetical protein JWQ68_520, partial [Cryobacterium sp.]|nr:hypothetical protein [Cryobacterium sp.]
MSAATTIRRRPKPFKNRVRSFAF